MPFLTHLFVPVTFD